LANSDAFYQSGGPEYKAEMDSYFHSDHCNGDVNDVLALASLSQTPPYSALEAGGHVCVGGVHPDEVIETSEVQDPHHSSYFLPFAFPLD
jgi:hypothetical protein